MKLLTVTVPCYNSQEYMEKCINSLLPGGDRVEIIIIDDGSRDQTGAIADAFAEKYPDIVRVIHQENGGHGEGINRGLEYATGHYFKVVDSDDWVSEDFLPFLDKLEACSKEEVDLFITNYYYVHSDGKRDRAICYRDCLPEYRVFCWEDTKSFKAHKLLTIHACTFRTDILRKWAHRLPKHIFYEDNLMVYQSLVHVNKMYYMNVDLYQYWIGRPDQSVQKSVMMQRYTHQLLVTELCFSACKLDDIPQKKLKKYLCHELFILFGISIVYARLHKKKESDHNMEQMFKNCSLVDEKWSRHFRYHTPLWLICIPGRLGYWISTLVYWFTNVAVIRFN